MTFPTQEELFELWQRTTPTPITEPLLGQPGEEIFQASAAVFAYLGRKLDNEFAQMYFDSASGPSFAEGSFKLWWDNRLVCPVRFGAGKLTIWGLKHGGSTLVPYANVDEIEIDPADSQPLTLDVQAVRPGADQDVLAKKLCVLFRNGEHEGVGATAVGTALTAGTDDFLARDCWRIIEVVAADNGDIVGEQRQIVAVSGGNATLNTAFSDDSTGISWRMVELHQVGLHGENEDDIEGGNFYNLDLLAGNRNVKRKRNEEDDSLASRASTLEDAVTGPAIQRALTRIMRKQKPGYEALYVGWCEGAEVAAFFSETGDGEDDLFAILDDPRDNPALAMSRLEMRGFFIVKVPEGYGWDDDDRELLYATIYDTIERIRMGGVGWTMIQDSDLG